MSDAAHLGPERPEISVVIPTYNRKERLGRAIRGVLGQNWSNLELIVVDDGSIDGTESSVREFDDPRLRYLRQERSGRCAARNRGAEAARGPWVTFLDSDDEVLPDWLEALLEARRTGSPIVCCGMLTLVEWDDGRVKYVGTRLPRPLGPVYENQIGLFAAGTFAVERTLFCTVGGYAEELETAENTELALRLVPLCDQRGQSISSVPRPLLVYRMRPLRETRYERGAQAQLDSASYILRRHGDRYRRLAPSAYANYCAIAGVNAARLGQFRQARRSLADAVLASPHNWKHYARLALTMAPPLARRLWRRPMAFEVAMS